MPNISVLQQICQQPFSQSSNCHQGGAGRYTPFNVRYGIFGDEYYDSLHHTPAKVGHVPLKSGISDCIDIMEDFSKNLTEVFTPNVCGCRFSYADCIAKL